MASSATADASASCLQRSNTAQTPQHKTMKDTSVMDTIACYHRKMALYCLVPCTTHLLASCKDNCKVHHVVIQHKEGMHWLPLLSTSVPVHQVYKYKQCEMPYLASSSLTGASFTTSPNAALNLSAALILDRAAMLLPALTGTLTMVLVLQPLLRLLPMPLVLLRLPPQDVAALLPLLLLLAATVVLLFKPSPDLTLSSFLLALLMMLLLARMLLLLL